MYGIANKNYGISGSSLHLMSGAKTADGEGDGQHSSGAKATALARRGSRSPDRAENDRMRQTVDRAALLGLDPAALEARLQEWFGDAARGVVKADGTVDFAKVQALMTTQRRAAGAATSPILNLAA